MIQVVICLSIIVLGIIMIYLRWQKMGENNFVNEIFEE